MVDAQSHAKYLETWDMEVLANKYYLPFAWSVCLERALPFAEDGLKPIQRKVVWTGYKEGLTDKSKFMKSATFEGKVMQYSPHSGAYNSICNIAGTIPEWQPRDIRLPLIEIKGSLGGLDSDPASSRYTELRLTKYSMELLKEVNENAVDLVPNYNNEDVEPVKLPARFPVALINGIPSAMAVGFACNLPSHNPTEIMDATIALVDGEISKQDVNVEKYIKGPDFNCGCDILPYDVKDEKRKNTISQYLKTGSGIFTMRSVWEEEEAKGQIHLHFTHLPYKVSPSKVMDEIKKKIEKGEFSEIVDMKDLSDLEIPVNLEIILKKGVPADIVISELLKKTSLQCTFAVNMTMIDNNEPKQLGIQEFLQSFIQFRKTCTRRKLEFRSKKLKDKLHLQNAVSAILLDIDKAIGIIRNSNNAQSAKNNLMREFKIDETQAKYILSLQLSRLTKADKHEIEADIKELMRKIKEIDKVLSSNKLFLEFIKIELEETREIVKDKRRCKIGKVEKIAKSEKVVKATTPATTFSFELDNDKKTITVCDNGRYALNGDTEQTGKIFVVGAKKSAYASIYDVLPGKTQKLSKFKIGTGVKGVLPNTGYAFIIGKGGICKLIDCSQATYKPNMRLLKEDIAAIYLFGEKEGGVEIEYKQARKSKKTISMADLECKSATHGGVSMFKGEILSTKEL